jgi:hypothetical protein
MRFNSVREKVPSGASNGYWSRAHGINTFHPFLGRRIILEIWNPVRAGHHEARRASLPKLARRPFRDGKPPVQDANCRISKRPDGSKRDSCHKFTDAQVAGGGYSDFAA